MSKSLLDRATIAQPCTTDWELMTGDERRRYCSHCDKHVYNLSAMTRPQAEALLRQTNGKLCARFERRADGAILTAPSAVWLPRLNRRFLRMAAALVSTALSFSPTIVAKPTKNLPVLNVGQDKQDKSQPQIKQQTGKIFGTIFDESKAVITNAKITLTDKSASQVIQSDAAGKYEFSVLAAGDYTLTFESPGFIKNVSELGHLESGAMREFDVILTVGQVGGLTFVEFDLPHETMPEGIQLRLRETMPVPVTEPRKNLRDRLRSIFTKAKPKPTKP